MWKENPTGIILPVSMAKKAERLELQCLDAPPLVAPRTTADDMADRRLAELNAIVDEAERLRPHELGKLLGVMGAGLATLSSAAEEKLMAVSAVQEKKPMLKARRMSGFDLDDEGHSMGLNNYGVAEAVAASPNKNVGRKIM